ncbi:MAG: Phosphate transporter ATP-binding protein [Ramlibacter sp.]|jgi:tungstate transport system ATP-binding protein|nr:Phosphate transporter ATP-binding protein [Ramlibacter sp.]
MTALMQLKSVDVRFGRVAALSQIDLKVMAGQRVALIGANGSGKSTLLRVLHGLLRPSAGSVLRDSAMRQAMVFQRPWMLRASVLSNVALSLWIRGHRWREAKALALPALARVGLSELAFRNASTLSGGQQQRLALARAWSLRPDVLLLDEPTSSLDPHAKREVEALMEEFARDGMTLVFASHNLGQVKRLATRVVYLEQGRVLADLPVRQFFDGPLLARTSREADLFLKGELA